MGPMKVTVSNPLLPVPYVWSSASTDDHVRSWRPSRHQGPHNQIVYVGDEPNRTRVAYDASGKPKHTLARLGQIIDLRV
jgi:hypothetical protein